MCPHEPAAQDDGEEEADQAGHAIEIIRAVLALQALEQEPGREGQSDGEEIGHVTEEVQRDVGEPRARHAGLVGDGAPCVGTGMGPGRVRGVIGQERDEDETGDGAQGQQAPLLEVPDDVPVEGDGRRGALADGLGQGY